ncbi:MAG: cell division protein ZapB [Synergistaceae bacterium]|nr:cell division protein ZapB [Synergistaceae bacterium]
MIKQFDQLESAVNDLVALIEGMKKENQRVKQEARDLKGVIDDRDLEILQLQEDLNKRSTEYDTEKNEIEHKLEGLLGRVSSITEEKGEN